ncbi:MAG: ATP-binding cassette, subfamily bacterial, partial [Miltoncostaeaceae bacterium]|nr:ATP-binding cassette, subfamily bacterial [Miltoncostaeaceae bacterium]
PDVTDAPDAVPAPPLRGVVSFHDVSFSYEGGVPVLEGVSFQVAPGQRVALIGPSGAGKSTIAALVLRFYDPIAGTVAIDGIDLRRMQLASLRAQIAIVPQDSVVFGTTIRENIAYGRTGATDEEIVAAAVAANAHDFIARLEDGYDTVVGERGATLSGGQRRRIAIARALVRDAPILILDEPMTGLDAASEASVREALDRLMAGRTCLTITHDLRAVEDCDLMLVLEAGRIVQQGRHEEILARSPSYRRLVQLQGGAAGAGSDVAVLDPAVGAAAEPRRRLPVRSGAAPPAAAAAHEPERGARGRGRWRAAAGGVGLLAAMIAGGAWWQSSRGDVAPKGGRAVAGRAAPAPAPAARHTAPPAHEAHTAVPRLVGRRLPAARASSAGLRVRARRVRAAAPPGVVLAQQPAAGKRVATGSTLVVTVAVGRRRPGPARLPAPPARVQARTSSAPATPAPATPAPATPAPGCGAQGTGWGAGWGSYRCR